MQAHPNPGARCCQSPTSPRSTLTMFESIPRVTHYEPFTPAPRIVVLSQQCEKNIWRAKKAPSPGEGSRCHFRFVPATPLRGSELFPVWAALARGSHSLCGLYIRTPSLPARGFNLCSMAHIRIGEWRTQKRRSVWGSRTQPGRRANGQID